MVIILNKFFFKSQRTIICIRPKIIVVFNIQLRISPESKQCTCEVICTKIKLSVSAQCKSGDKGKLYLIKKRAGLDNIYYIIPGAGSAIFPKNIHSATYQLILFLLFLMCYQ